MTYYDDPAVAALHSRAAAVLPIWQLAPAIVLSFAVVPLQLYRLMRLACW